jgi:DNA-binding MarR family transcriptional regulator
MPAPPDDIFQQTIDRFWESFPPVWNAVRSNVRSIASQQFDITVEQFHILRHIRKGACSISDLANVGRISRPAISQAVDALVKKALVNRQRSTGDRRYVRLELTGEGSALLDAIFAQSRKWMKVQLTSLNVEDLRSVMCGMIILKGAFEGTKK